ncbi:transcriptional regulator, TetR family [Jatrophihabitans endophyticus]|uniref:Transcriptional regulator, TetR family n=1 Tax=Jatrophihabitans endophyticus TaxID=1206085 RepID=A0A1M5GAB2_9ACTN|nr:transcriptional regulator, TetR family [Jatrophihabitans endophyticus]
MGRPSRRADALSRERIIAAAITILDTEGERALTFRTLAATLATGPGAIYWHVANKKELLAAATDALVAEATGAGPTRATPHERIRRVALGLFDTIDAHPWIGSQLSQEPWQLASMRIVEALGRPLDDLEVPAERHFHVVTALASYVLGAAAQNAANARHAPRDTDRDTALSAIARQWAELDEAEFPFVRRIAAQLPGHDDREQFLAGIDLVLGGITRE